MGTVDSGTQAAADSPREQASSREAELLSRHGLEDLPAVEVPISPVAGERTLVAAEQHTSVAAGAAGNRPR